MKRFERSRKQSPQHQYYSILTPQSTHKWRWRCFIPRNWNARRTQDEHPLMYASRALTTAEQRNSQIEKELLALVFDLEHNHYYTCGRKLTLWTDHKLLVSIANQPLVSAPKRLQRLMLRLQQYDVAIRYKLGKEMFLADTLSRAYLPDHQQSDVEKEVESTHPVNHLTISQERFAEIQKETLSDPSLLRKFNSTTVSETNSPCKMKSCSRGKDASFQRVYARQSSRNYTDPTSVTWEYKAARDEPVK